MDNKIRIVMAKPGLDGHDRGIKILNDEILQKNFNDEIPTGVSIESASYIEKNDDNNHTELVSQDKKSFEGEIENEYTPKLFSEEHNTENSEQNDIPENQNTNELFDQDSNEDEDFEIPAFLRRQKF